MNNSGCPSFVGCKAPLCPMDSSFESGAIWYTGEDICSSRKYRKERWRINQRKIEKINLKYGVKGYFNVGMLMVLKRIGKGISGK